MRSAIQFVFLCLGSALTAASQIGVPLVGLVVDPQARVRSVIGIPGAANLGPAANLDPSLQTLAIAPHHDYVVGLQGPAQDLVLVARPTADAPASVLVPGAGAVQVTLSPRGSALLAMPSGQVWTGLPANPALSWTADFSSLGSGVGAFAVSDDGKAILAAAQAGDRVSIVLATPGAGVRTFSSVASLGGLAFVPGLPDVLLADGLANQVQLIHDVAGQAAASLIADGSAGIAGPVDVAASEDGRTVLVANSQPGGVTMVNLATGTRTNLACQCTPAVLARLSSASVFRLTDPAAGLFWIVDGGLAPRIVGIAPDAPVEAVQQ
jgi:DNA-binding beta-propeller fold protein YncE